jgi:hypothetical protein
MPHRSRTYLICLLGALAIAVIAPGASASSSSSCNETAIYNQAYNGKITGHFSIACLQKARRDESAEMATYSNVDSVISAAIAKAQFVQSYNSGNRGQVTPTQTVAHGSGTGTTAGGTAPKGGTSTTSSASTQGSVGIVDPPTHPGLATRVLAGYGAPAKADDFPTPIIALGALATLFVLGGIGSYLLRRRMDGSSAV